MKCNIMNRFKKYVRSKGIKLSCDYMYLPFEEKPYIFVEDCLVNKNTMQVIKYLNIGNVIMTFNRDGSISYDFD